VLWSVDYAAEWNKLAPAFRFRPAHGGRRLATAGLALAFGLIGWVVAGCPGATSGLTSNSEPPVEVTAQRSEIAGRERAAPGRGTGKLSHLAEQH
jgi:hypothetical protein